MRGLPIIVEGGGVGVIQLERITELFFVISECWSRSVCASEPACALTCLSAGTKFDFSAIPRHPVTPPGRPRLGPTIDA